MKTETCMDTTSVYDNMLDYDRVCLKITFSAIFVASRRIGLMIGYIITWFKNMCDDCSFYSIWKHSIMKFKMF